MGYSKNKISLLKIESALLPLKEYRAAAWDRPDGDADRWAYKVRQALYIAARFPSEFPELAEASKRYKIMVVNDNLVQAVVTGAPSEATLRSPESAMAQGLVVAGAPHDYAAVQTAQEIMEAWYNVQPSNDKIHFPEAMLSDEQLTIAANFAAERTPPWMLLKARPPQPGMPYSLTLAPNDDRVPAAARVPSTIKRNRL